MTIILGIISIMLFGAKIMKYVDLTWFQCSIPLIILIVLNTFSAMWVSRQQKKFFRKF